jgi:hypothetical protein
LPDARRREELDGLLSAVAGNLVNAARAGGDADCQRTFVYQLLRHLTGARTDQALGLADVAAAAVEPETVGMEDADRFIKKGEREKLSRKLHGLLFGPSASLFSGGQPLDLGQLLRPRETGKVPLNVIYLNALPDDEQKQLFVAALAAEVYRWMVTEGSGGAKPQVLVYLDEARDFIPAGARKPPAKDPLVRLFAQGRKYGVACLIGCGPGCGVVRQGRAGASLAAGPQRGRTGHVRGTVAGSVGGVGGTGLEEPVPLF